MRKLASIQKIATLAPITGADKIELCTLDGLGWEIVVKKNEFNVGDLIVYCEVDSILPEKPEFEFLRERKFRIRTIRLKKQISQGIVFPLSILPEKKRKGEIGDDLTEVLEITKYDPQLQEEKQLNVSTKKSSPLTKFMMGFAWFRVIYFWLNKKDKGWPSWIAKTDEERIENCLSVLTSRPNSEWYVAEKIDGQSFSCFVDSQKRWGFSRLFFGVCSRNVRLAKPDNSSYWAMANKYEMERKLMSLGKEKIVVQSENIGQRIQGNKYRNSEGDMYVFNVIENGIRYTLEKMLFFCKQHGLKVVPILNENWVFDGAGKSPQDIMHEITQMSIGNSVLNKDIPREGIVVRLKSNPSVSFKKINPEFLLKYNE